MMHSGIIEQLELPSTLDSLTKIESFIEECCDQCNLNKDCFGNILIALTEGVNNAIVHGNKYDKNKMVLLNVESSDIDVEFTIIDEGGGFDYNNVPDPTLPENLEKLSGRGVFLMRQLADEVVFEQNGSIVRLRFLGLNN